MVLKLPWTGRTPLSRLTKLGKLCVGGSIIAIGGGTLYWATREDTANTEFESPPLEQLNVTHKRLPQYGANFKVKQCGDYNLPDFVEINKVRAIKSRNSDVWIVSYPKSGTTWVQEIVNLMLQRKMRSSMMHSVRAAVTYNLDDRSPFVEFPCPGLDAVDRLPSPRVLKTHLPLQLLPPSILDNPAVKIIYVTRNPRDVAVSLYHFMTILNEVQMSESFGFSDFIEDFLSGDLPYSPYVSHVASYARAAAQPGLDDRILLLHYEDLKTNLKREVDRISAFLNLDELVDEEFGWLQHYTRFDVMRAQKTSNYSWLNDKGIIKEGGKFMRKGEVGDWKAHLSEDQIRRFETLIEKPLLAATGHRNANVIEDAADS